MAANGSHLTISKCVCVCINAIYILHHHSSPSSSTGRTAEKSRLWNPSVISMQKKVPSVEVGRLVLGGWDSPGEVGLTTDTSDTWSPLIRGVESTRSSQDKRGDSRNLPYTHIHTQPPSSGPRLY